MKTANFIIILTVMALAICGIAYIFVQPHQVLTLLIAVSLAYLSTIIAYIAANMGVQNPKLFWNTLMVNMLVKMMVGLVSCTIAVFLFRPLAITYISCYFLAYFLFTAFEVYVLMRNLRPISEKEEDTSN